MRCTAYEDQTNTNRPGSVRLETVVLCNYCITILGIVCLALPKRLKLTDIRYMRYRTLRVLLLAPPHARTATCRKERAFGCSLYQYALPVCTAVCAQRKIYGNWELHSDTRPRPRPNRQGSISPSVP